MSHKTLDSQLEVLRTFSRPWFVAGGWAIDLFLGRKTREHQDVDVAVFREDQFELQRHLSGWCWQKRQDGKSADWLAGDWLELPVHEVYANQSERQLEFLLNERREGLWIYRRDPTITLPIAQFCSYQGLPVLPPQVVLLYKSQRPLPKDLADFRQAWPQLGAQARRWLSAAMVRTRKQAWNPVELVEYHERWSPDFARIVSELAAVLGRLAIAYEHVGSTSVPGLAAKPIIDIDVVIRSSADFPKVRDQLDRFGYIHQGPCGVEGREVFRCVIDLPKHHLYVCEEFSRPLVEHLTFRDRLRRDPALATAYATLKKELAEKFRTDRESYTKAKTDFVRSVLA